MDVGAQVHWRLQVAIRAYLYTLRLEPLLYTSQKHCRSATSHGSCVCCSNQCSIQCRTSAATSAEPAQTQFTEFTTSAKPVQIQFTTSSQPVQNQVTTIAPPVYNPHQPESSHANDSAAELLQAACGSLVIRMYIVPARQQSPQVYPRRPTPACRSPAPSWRSLKLQSLAS